MSLTGGSFFCGILLCLLDTFTDGLSAGSTQSISSRKELGGIKNSNQVLFLFFKDRKAACVYGGGGVHRL